MSPREQGDALVIFGMTGDLAFRQIFPALQRMVQAGELNVPVVGVAREHWNLEKLRERARESLEASTDGLDPAAFAKLCALMRYAGGTYDDPKTYGDARERAAGLRSPGALPRDPAVAVRDRRRPPRRRGPGASAGASSSRSRSGATSRPRRR